MARILNKIAGTVVEEYNKITQDSAGVLTGPLNKLWRARILLNRATSLLPKDNALEGKLNNPNGVFGEWQISSKNPDLNRQLKEKWRLEIQFKEFGEDKPKAKAINVPTNLRYKNKVRLYNLTSDPVRYITLQNRPSTIDFRGETSWATIKSMGRNTPMYHYTGSEDIIQFNISWFCDDPDNPAEVLTKCRLLESWTKSNGYQAAPPLIKIEWGESGMFDNHYYILTSATYTLANFQNGYRIRESGKPEQYGNRKLLPATATQELIFKRVSSYSLSYGDILSEASIKNTKGIES